MSTATINWISGPVLRAHTNDMFHINEAALVGKQQLLGEVIRIEQNTIVAQVYEDTSGIQPGDQVVGQGSALSVKLGPGLLGGIFDGLLRPLHTDTGYFIQPGMTLPPCSMAEFTPLLESGNVSVYSVNRIPFTMEDVFISLIGEHEE